MIREIMAKTLLSRVPPNDTIFGLDYSFNLYRGCQHRCIYCDSRSRCYGIDHFDRDILVKVNAIDLLRDELTRKRRKGIIGTGSMNDPYMPLEATTRLTCSALEIIAEYGFGVHIITKSDLVVRDIDLLKRISRVAAAVSFTITTTDETLCTRIEPGAPPSSVRLAAMRELSKEGIETRVALMPVLPFIEDNWENISDVIHQARDCGARVIIPWMGMSMRDRQREYFYARLDELFPGLRSQYERRYGDEYSCPSPHAQSLYRKAQSLCDQLGLATHVSPLLSSTAEHLSLFEVPAQAPVDRRQSDE